MNCNIYKNIENLAKNRPFLFWLITLLLTSIPIISLWKYIKSLLLINYTLQGYIILLIIIFPLLLVLALKLFVFDSYRRKILKELRSLKAKLDHPFEYEETNIRGSQKLIKKYYHFEILECFDNYNSIVKKIRNRWPKKYNDLKFRNVKPRIYKGDWVDISYMQVIKSDIINLIEKLK